MNRRSFITKTLAGLAVVPLLEQSPSGVFTPESSPQFRDARYSYFYVMYYYGDEKLPRTVRIDNCYSEEEAFRSFAETHPEYAERIAWITDAFTSSATS